MRIFEGFGASIGGHRRGSGLARLTEREQQVLELVGGGLTNKEIATRLQVTESTVKYHVSNLLTKLVLRNRAEVAAFVGRGQTD